MKYAVAGRLKQFEIDVPNKPGSLADVCEMLSGSGINIKAISTEVKSAGNGTVKVVTYDENSTKDVLSKGKFKFGISDILHLRLIDRPGEMAKVARLLARAGVNIDSVFILGSDPVRGETEVALKVSDMDAAMGVLGG